MVLGVEDAPLLDDLSIFVAHQIVQRGGAKVVFTVRNGEPVPAAIQEVLKQGQFDRLELQPLSRDDTDTLLSATLGGSLDPDSAARLWELTPVPRGPPRRPSRRRRLLRVGEQGDRLRRRLTLTP